MTGVIVLVLLIVGAVFVTPRLMGHHGAAAEDARPGRSGHGGHGGGCCG